MISLFTENKRNESMGVGSRARREPNSGANAVGNAHANRYSNLTFLQPVDKAATFFYGFEQFIAGLFCECFEVLH